MTGDRRDEDDLGRRLAALLETAAGGMEVGDAWDAIARRAVEPTSASTGSGQPAVIRRLRRWLPEIAVGLGVAAAIALALIIGWRLAVVTPSPVEPVTPTVPRYDPAIPTLVVYRTTAGRDQPTDTAGSFTIIPERMRTDSADTGRAALTAMFDTAPVAVGPTPASVPKIGRADIASVVVSGGLIRVELSSFASPHYPEPEARVIAQTWVRTLQDTLGVRDDVLIRRDGRPLVLYGAIDTTEPLTRDETVPAVRPDGLDSPRSGDIVPSTFILLGTATAAAGRPARVVLTDLDTGLIAYQQELPGPGDRSAPVDFQPVLTLEPGRYRATVSGIGAVAGARDVTFTVVA